MLMESGFAPWLPRTLFGARAQEQDDGWIIARLIKKSIPASGPCRILDMGCGDGGRLLKASERNRELRGVGLVHPGEDAPLALRQLVVSGGLRIVASEACRFQAQAVFDRIFLCEWLRRHPAEQRLELLLYCKMLLRPGGMLVTTALENDSSRALQPDAINLLLCQAGYSPVRRTRLSGSLHLFTGSRIDQPF